MPRKQDPLHHRFNQLQPEHRTLRLSSVHILLNLIVNFLFVLISVFGKVIVKIHLGKVLVFLSLLLENYFVLFLVKWDV